MLRLARLAEADDSTSAQAGPAAVRGRILREMADKLNKNEFMLAVVGEFSRGKTSLVNALLNEAHLLPTSIEPNTAAVTLLTYAPERTVRVTFRDGTVAEDLDREQWARYVAAQSAGYNPLREADGRRPREEQDPEGGEEEVAAEASGSGNLPIAGPQGVDTVHISLPSPMLHDGLCLVDTPGLGSIVPEHGEATRRFIHRADAVLFIINTDPVIGQSECNFLSFLRDYVKRFIFVVTKIDLFTPEERTQSVRYTQRTIEQYAGLPDAPIYAVSARLAQEGRAERNEAKFAASGFTEFLHGLEVFLIRERGQEFIKQHIQAALAHVQDLKNSTLIELQALQASPVGLPARVEAVRSVLESARSHRGEILKQLAQARRPVENLLEWFNPEAEVLLQLRLQKQVEAEVDSYDWEQLQRAAETIPILVRDRLHESLRDQFLALAQQLLTLRDEILLTSSERLSEINAELEKQFGGVRLPDPQQVTLRFDAEEFCGRLRAVGTFTVGSILTPSLSRGVMRAVAMLGGSLARQALPTSCANSLKRISVRR
jgi:GTP-binding protein EngB required for normal cell division